MKQIFSFTGAQCTGKSTLLSAVHKHYSDVLFVPEVTRLVKHKAGVEINENGDDVTQLLILAEHLQNVYYNPDMVKILDRCALDGMVYSTWLLHMGKITPETHGHSVVLFERLVKCYTKVFYTMPFSMSITDDGERSINVDFRNEILNMFEDAISQYSNVLKDKLIRVEGTVSERVEFVNNIINENI